MLTLQSIHRPSLLTRCWDFKSRCLLQLTRIIVQISKQQRLLVVVQPVSLCSRKASSPNFHFTLSCAVCCMPSNAPVCTQFTLHLLFCRHLFRVQFLGVQLVVLHAHLLLSCLLARWPAHLHFFDVIHLDHILHS